jgi:hypothetical protein
MTSKVLKNGMNKRTFRQEVVPQQVIPAKPRETGREP